MNQANSRWQMPAEWAHHRGCYIAWPCRDEIWALGVKAAKDAYAQVIDAIAQVEPVTLLVNPAQLAEAQRWVPHHNVTFVAMPLNDSWARDITPLFVQQGQARGAIDFGFNAWGEKFHPYDKDAAMGAQLLAHLKQQRPDFHAMSQALILEGGSIHVDGQGTLLTTAECLLHPKRNPHLSQAQIEQQLMASLGVDKVLWLPDGLWGDVDTDGHIDNIATFTQPGRILTMTTEDQRDPNYRRYQANIDALAGQTDAQGRPLEWVTIPQPERPIINDEPLALSYINYYLANDAVIIPAFGQADYDREAATIIAAQFPEREVVAIDALPILAGGGGIHCITMQEPN